MLCCGPFIYKDGNYDMSPRRLVVNEWARSHTTDHITPAIQIVYNAYFGDGFFLKIEEGGRKKVLLGRTKSCYTLVWHMLGTSLSDFRKNPMIFDPQNCSGASGHKMGFAKNY